MNVLLLAQGLAQRSTEMFFGLDPDQRFVMLIIAFGCLTGIIISAVAIIGGIVETMHRRRTETDLKREMLDRGMSADEIARVVESAQPKDFLERWAAGQGKGKK
jgi:hypothetical protein